MEITGVRDCWEGFPEEVFERLQDEASVLTGETGRSSRQHCLGARAPPSGGLSPYSCVV